MMRDPPDIARLPPLPTDYGPEDESYHGPGKREWMAAKPTASNGLRVGLAILALVVIVGGVLAYGWFTA